MKKLPTLRERWNQLGDNAGLEISSEDFIRIYNDYVVFTAQEPQLGDYIPCDKDGVPLEKPESKTKFGYAGYSDEWKEYQQACDRVLFEGWKIKEKTKTLSNGNTFIAYYRHDKLQFVHKTIESLIESGIELTPTQPLINKLSL